MFGKKSKPWRMVGRLENEYDPDAPMQGLDQVHPVVGRTYNEEHSLTHHGVNLAHPIVGRIYNELHPGTPLWRGPARRKIGRIYNDRLPGK